MRRFPTALLALLVVSGPAAGQGRDPTAAALATLRAGQLRAHLQFLASDALEGRAPGTRGGRLAAEYIAAQFERAGLQPLGGEFLHEVPLIAWRADPAATYLRVGDGPRALRLEHGDQLVLWAPAAAPRTRVLGPLLFAGYGIRAPEHRWDDYPIPVRGRILMVLAGEPPATAAEPDLFDGGALTWYGRWTSKLEQAARLGAAGVLIVHTDDGAGYPWDVVRTSWGGEVLSLAQDTSALPPVVGWIDYAAAAGLLQHSGHSLDELAARAGERGFTPLELEPVAALQAGGQVRQLSSANVAGVLRGTHASRGQEYVAYTAHYDGFGIRAAAAGDSIFNGAYDNASGVAALIELAEAWGALREGPERSILFIATTAEEAGMLGARHFTQRGPVPLPAVTAVLNLDGANLWGETEDIGGTGLERSTLGELLAQAAARLGMRAVGERAPEQGYFFRSDHFPFARAGIPAITLEHGLDYRGRPRGWGERVVGAYLARNYHAPTDELDASFDLRGAVQQARVAFLLGHLVATRTQPPAWYDAARAAPPWAVPGRWPARAPGGTPSRTRLTPR